MTTNLKERAEECAKESVGNLGRDMILELVAEIVGLEKKLVVVEEAYKGSCKDRLRLYKRWLDNKNKR